MEEEYYLSPSTVAMAAVELWEDNVLDGIRAFGDENDDVLLESAYDEIEAMARDYRIAQELLGRLEPPITNY